MTVSTHVGCSGGERATILGALIAASLIRVCGAATTGGEVTLRPNSTVFLTKFCFSFNPEGIHDGGNLDFDVQAPAGSRWNRVYMVLLDDEVDSYTGPSSAWDSLTCEERLGKAKQVTDLDWTLASRRNGQHVAFSIRQKLRPRWWYVALLDCSDSPSAPELTLTYEAHMENLHYGALSEFSTDRRFTLHLFLGLTMVYTALFFAQVHANKVVALNAGDDSASGKAAHPFARILTIGIGMGLGQTFLFSFNALVYAFDGIGAPFFAVIAQLLSTTSSFVLASLMLLVSEGKCVSYIMVAGDAKKVLRLLGPFVVSCCALELWGEYSLRRNYTTDYVYTTPIGWALILVDLVLLGLYARNLHATWQSEKDTDEGAFYRTWGVFFGVWFLALPVTAVLAQVILAQYTWLIVSLSVKQGLTMLIYAGLVAGLWPGNARTYFKLDAAESIAKRCFTSSVVWRPPPSPSRAAGAPAPSAQQQRTDGKASSLAASFAPFKKPLPGLLGSGTRLPPMRAETKQAQAERSTARKPSLGMSP